MLSGACLSFTRPSSLRLIIAKRGVKTEVYKTSSASAQSRVDLPSKFNLPPCQTVSTEKMRRPQLHHYTTIRVQCSSSNDYTPYLSLNRLPCSRSRMKVHVGHVRTRCPQSRQPVHCRTTTRLLPRSHGTYPAPPQCPPPSGNFLALRRLL